jgi:hypothetical protein
MKRLLTASWLVFVLNLTASIAQANSISTSTDTTYPEPPQPYLQLNRV